MLRRNPGEVAALVALAQERERAGETEAAGRALRGGALAIALGRPRRADAGRELFAAAGRTGGGGRQFDRLVENYGASTPRCSRCSGSAGGTRSGGRGGRRAQSSLDGRIHIDGCRRNIDPDCWPCACSRRGTRAQAAEVDCVTERLRTAGRWDESYLAWLNSPAPRAPSRRGLRLQRQLRARHERRGFRLAHCAWQRARPGHAVMFAPAPGGVGAAGAARDLQRQAPGWARHRGVLLAVPAGATRFSGLARMDKLNSVRGLQWTVRCQRKRAPRRRSPSSERFLGVSEWRRFAFEGGGSQGLRRAGAAAGTRRNETRATTCAGTAWFDDLRLTRALTRARQAK